MALGRVRAASTQDGCGCFRVRLFDVEPDATQIRQHHADRVFIGQEGLDARSIQRAFCRESFWEISEAPQNDVSIEVRRRHGKSIRSEIGDGVMTQIKRLDPVCSTKDEPSPDKSSYRNVAHALSAPTGVAFSPQCVYPLTHLIPICGPGLDSRSRRCVVFWGSRREPPSFLDTLSCQPVDSKRTSFQTELDRSCCCNAIM
jgi:hypothetical protein